jgi:hypothetical protein
VRQRDEVEAVLRSWDAYERMRGSAPVIDYDCHPDPVEPTPAASRLEVFEKLSTLMPEVDGQPHIQARVRSDLAYLRALMGERPTLAAYVMQTQGCVTTGWPDDYVAGRGSAAQECLDQLGIAWDADAMTNLAKHERPLAVEDAAAAIRQAATELEPAVRNVVGSDAPYSLTVETVDIDAYWAYWLDGIGENARLRLNLRHAQFTEVQARQFALHEILGHALQAASYTARAAKDDVPWVRLLSVHAPQQILLEGLAQALPLFVTPDDQDVTTRVRLAHYLQLLRARLHLAIDAGSTIEDCARWARQRAPFWDDEDIANVLTDRSVNPQLRTYLWAYPAGIDWFARLAEAGGNVGRTILQAAYRDPLTPADLEDLWPGGPTVGGQLTIGVSAKV